MTEGVDYAWDRPSAAGLAAAGKKFAVRYGGPGSDGKQLQAAELRDLLAAGIAVVANAEGAANGFRGRTAGRSWAQQAEDHFRALGMPDGRPIYFSADWDVQPGEMDAVDEALRGAAEVIGAARVGLYGGRRVIAHAKSAATARWLWQTYAWSGGLWVSGTHLQQYRNGVSLAGGTVDLCRAMVADYGQWGQQEDDVTKDEVKAAVLEALQSPMPIPGRIGERMTAAGWAPDMSPWEAISRVLEFVVLGRDRLVADIAAAVAALPADPGTTVDYDQLADAIVRRVLTGGTPS